MKLLTETADTEEYFRIKLLFEQKGIAAHFANEDSARNFGFLHPAGRYAIYVVFEEQYEDAKKLLVNDDHHVETTMDLSNSDFASINSDENKKLVNNKIINVIVALLVVICLITYFVIS